MLDRRPRGAPGQTVPWTGVRNYQARNFMRDADARRRRRAVLSLVVPRAGHGRHRRSGAARPTPTPRSSTRRATTTTPSRRARTPRWVQRGREAGAQDARCCRSPKCASAPSWRRCACCKRGNRLSITPVTADEWRAVLAPARAAVDLLASSRCSSLELLLLGVLRRLPGRPAGHRRRHDDGAVPDAACCRAAACRRRWR